MNVNDMRTKSVVKPIALTLLLSATVSLHAADADFASWVRDCGLQDGAVITLPPGVHHVYPDKLSKRFLHIANNDDGHKAILFDLSGKKNITIDGNGAELRMHGHVIPFYMKNAENITIRNLIIDWAHPFYAQGEIIDAGKDWIEIRFEKEYTVEIHKGELVAINPDMTEPVHLHNINYIDPEKGEQAYQSVDEYQALKPGNYQASRNKKGIVRLESRFFRNKPAKGQIAVFQYDGRTSPAIAVQNSENLTIEKVTQYHAGAIANIFEDTKNIHIDRMTMTRRGDRWFSALNDATHFVDCSGSIRITDSLFEFQGDDALNIHGIYRPIEKKLPGNGLRLRLVHFQQFGVDTIQPGDILVLCRAENFEPVQNVTVKSVKWHEGGERCDVYLENPLPELDWENTIAMRHEEDVDLLIARNRIQNNRARGLLIKTLGKVRIQDNYFHTPGAAVKMRIDASSWYESGPVDNVEICDNVFDQCKFGGWSKALFEIDPTLNDKDSDAPVMKNIRIHNNRIISIFEPLITANNTENLEFHDNTLSDGKDYRHWGRKGQPFLFGKGVTTGKMQ